MRPYGPGRGLPCDRDHFATAQNPTTGAANGPFGDLSGYTSGRPSGITVAGPGVPGWGYFSWQLDPLANPNTPWQAGMALPNDITGNNYTTGEDDRSGTGLIGGSIILNGIDPANG